MTQFYILAVLKKYISFIFTFKPISFFHTLTQKLAFSLLKAPLPPFRDFLGKGLLFWFYTLKDVILKSEAFKLQCLFFSLPPHNLNRTYAPWQIPHFVTISWVKSLIWYSNTNTHLLSRYNYFFHISNFQVSTPWFFPAHYILIL